MKLPNIKFIRREVHSWQTVCCPVSVLIFMLKCIPIIFKIKRKFIDEIIKLIPYKSQVEEYLQCRNDSALSVDRCILLGI